MCLPLQPEQRPVCMCMRAHAHACTHMNTPARVCVSVRVILAPVSGVLHLHESDRVMTLTQGEACAEKLDIGDGFCGHRVHRDGLALHAAPGLACGAHALGSDSKELGSVPSGPLRQGPRTRRSVILAPPVS